jgi:hypothetical protein
MTRFVRLTLFALLPLAGIAGILGSCNGRDPTQPDPTTARVCVDAQEQRIDDDACIRKTTGAGPSAWYYLAGLSGTAPPTGAEVAGGSFIPTNGVVYHSVTPKGVIRSGLAETIADLIASVRNFGKGTSGALLDLRAPTDPQSAAPTRERLAARTSAPSAS